MRVCLIDPRGIHKGLNTGLAYIASYLMSKPDLTEVKVIDFNNGIQNINSVVDDISAFDVIGFSVKSFTLATSLEIAQKVKRKKNTLAAGGAHISIDAENFLRENELFDFAISGEGEDSFGKLIDTLLYKRNNYDEIPGLFYRNGGEISSSKKLYRITSLDSLPFPSYEIFSSYSGKILNYPLVTSRGCPYPCTYCCVSKVIGKHWIGRSVENIIEELKIARKNYNIFQFNIQDDNFSMDIERAKEFCNALIVCNEQLKWSCPNGIRADRLDVELLGLMKKSGCFGIALGIESANEKEYKAIKKSEDFQKIIEAIKSAQNTGIRVYGNFIIGLPYSSLESIRETVRFAKKLKLDACIFNLLSPFPGTEIWDWVNSNGKWLVDWKQGFTQGKDPRILFETDEFPRHHRIYAYSEANIKLKNYFAFINEHEGTFKNIINVVEYILKYDFFGIFSHLKWIFVNRKRIIMRIRGNDV